MKYCLLVLRRKINFKGEALNAKALIRKITVALIKVKRLFQLGIILVELVVKCLILTTNISMEIHKNHRKKQIHMEGMGLH
jgi:hypothetical protein